MKSSKEKNSKNLAIIKTLKTLPYNQTFSNFFTQAFTVTNPNKSLKWNWHHELICNYLEKIENKEITRLIINVPPRSLKSQIVNVAWPAWLIGKDPSKKIICASYSQKLSNKFSQDTRLILNDRWYKTIFPKVKFSTDQNEKHKFVTTNRGFRLATSIKGTLLGEGGDILILDDPHNPKEINSPIERKNTIDWFEQSFITRLDDKKTGSIVLIMQRLHPEDLTGYILSKNLGWEHLVIPAIAEKDQEYSVNDFKHFRKANEILCPEYEGEKELNRLKAELGTYTFLAQYQQSPVIGSGNVIQKQWLKFYINKPTNFDKIIQSWDCGLKTGSNNDYSVCTTWGICEGNIYLLDVWRDKVNFPKLLVNVKAIHEKWLPDIVLIEDKASGTSLLQELDRQLITAIPITPRRDKETRLVSVSTFFEAGKIYFPEGAHFMPDYINELTQFPNVIHDDQVDSTSQALEYIKKNGKTIIGLRSA
ncbi:MAG: phage terminase large subunit [Sphingobacteriia bacterium]|nr:phage terminase large subunit [Sphingobacteriia bacterium]